MLNDNNGTNIDISHLNDAKKYKNILDVSVSCFAYKGTKQPPKEVNLLVWLKSQKYRQQIELLRTQPKHIQKALKSTLPAITVAGIFAAQHTDAMRTYTALMSIDIDNVDTEAIRQKLCGLPYIAYCGLSCSGNGLWAIVPVTSDKENYKPHFEALKQELQGYGIKIDALPDLMRFRFYSFDDNAYFNPGAEIYTSMFLPAAIENHYIPNDKFTQVHLQLSKIEKLQVDICENYTGWITLGAALYSEFGENGLGFFQRLSALRPADAQAANPENVKRKYALCAKMKRVSIATFFFHTKKYLL